MKYPKIFVIITAIFFGIYGLFVFIFVPYSFFDGDLTRVGLIAEESFGWRKHQPSINSEFLIQSKMNSADVLVVGDSYSVPGLWQSVLVGKSLKVRTEDWGQLFGICEDFTDWLNESKFKGDFIIFQVVERSLNDIIDRSISCKKMMYLPTKNTEKTRAQPKMNLNFDVDKFNGTLYSGMLTKYNQFNLEKEILLNSKPEIVLSKDVKIKEVENGCNLFSHHFCRYSLFLSWDSELEVDEHILNNIKLLTARVIGPKVIWSVVPNKSTSYLYNNKKFWQNLNSYVDSVDLLALSINEINNHHIDFYPANNTHYSTSGYLKMGEKIYERLESVRN